MKVVKPLILSTILAFSGQSAHALASEYDEMKKQLQIMDKIITSSLADVDNTGRFSIGNIDSTYLKGQGVLFTLDTRSGLSNWAEGFKVNLPDMPALLSGAEIEINEDELERITEEAMAIAEQATGAFESFYQGREGYHQVRESQRDAQYRLRDVSRELRDIEYQLNVAPEKEVAKLESKKSELTQLKETLTSKVKKLSEKVEEYQKQKEAERQEQLKLRQSYYTNVAQTLAETICLYGNGLRALPNKENVNIVMKSAGSKDDNRFRDRVYVFSKRDISDCASEKITAKQLLAKGSGYQF
ncbi:hypothetical protein [Thalassotalea ganghwensis]